MIGVVTDPKNEAVVREFFELFKTPWEFYQTGRQYDVLLCDRHGFNAAELVLVYASQDPCYETTDRIDTAGRPTGGESLVYKGLRLPIYGNKNTFPGKEHSLLVDANSGEPALYVERSDGTTLVRIGYDLFHEIRTLLTAGQPASNASVPALELHIALLRDVITSTGVQLIEVPPAPQGYQFIACLTHDVDHPSIRKHVFDHTMFGFLYRAFVVSVLNVFRRRISVRQMLTNWVAALKLPFVHLGLAKDFWQTFDRYPKLEGGPHSSFFVIPFKGDAGRCEGGQAPKRRASGYGACEIAGEINALISAGCEVGLHGIDAWCDPAKGREELEEIRRVAGVRNVGVRMHWLYSDEHSPAILENAGADYDSTVGYNDAVGYRAGTTQVYKPLEAVRLLELPLHIMDTALFFPARLQLSGSEANGLVDGIIDNAVRLGGVVTVNWHDRSVAPERLWGDFYVQLLEKLKNRGAWFATAGQTVAWFRKRRSASFEFDRQSDVLVVKDTFGRDPQLPALLVLIHNDQPHIQSKLPAGATSSCELPLRDGMHVSVAVHECTPEVSTSGALQFRALAREA
jgi:hypothetical protein